MLPINRDAAPWHVPIDLSSNANFKVIFVIEMS